MGLEIIPYQHRSPLLEKAAYVYARVWERDVEESIVYYRRYAKRDHFYGFVAQFKGKTIGSIFGTASLPGQWWHDKVAERVGKNHPKIQNAWLLTELAVVAPYRNFKIGEKLHNKVLEEQPFPNVLLSTQVSNTDAQRFYKRLGWEILHPGFEFNPGNEPYVIMYKELDE